MTTKKIAILQISGIRYNGHAFSSFSFKSYDFILMVTGVLGLLLVVVLFAPIRESS